MSSYSLPEFKFPKTMFTPKYDLPNKSHPWFTKFKSSAEESVFHLVTQEAMEYPASLSILKGLRELEREMMLTEYHDVYSVIEKFKVIREANCLHEGMFSFYEPEQSNLGKFFLQNNSIKRVSQFPEKIRRVVGKERERLRGLRRIWGILQHRNWTVC
jgi:hypothetical protein